MNHHGRRGDGGHNDWHSRDRDEAASGQRNQAGRTTHAGAGAPVMRGTVVFGPMVPSRAMNPGRTTIDGHTGRVSHDPGGHGLAATMLGA
jgi:hypothetical protein